METEELEFFVKGMFEGENPHKPISLRDMQFGMKDGAKIVVSIEDLEAACESLALQGMLEEVALGSWATTAEYEEEKERDFMEFLSHEVADHVIKKAAKK